MSRDDLDQLLPADDKELMRRGFEEIEGPEKEILEALDLSFEDIWPLIRKQVPDPKGLIAQIGELMAPVAREQWRSQFGSDVGVISLSEEPDVLLMWSHYADNHAGFVIEFDPGHSFFWQPRSENDELRHLRQVSYSRKRPSGSMLDLGAEGLFLTKSAHWSYENEWRILFAVDEADYVLNEDDDYPIYQLSLPPETVSSVIIGCRASEALREEVLAITSSDGPLPHAEALEASQSSDTFDLEIAPMAEG